ncbi:hypothetical protein [Marinomonas sp. THO17]|uniref:hypothetical protein n=1 Tax=Marinomonas sp. THO17 TaxID=3149048 RepID=UPI00336BEE88
MQILFRSIEYWNKNWDWEMPTLLGGEKVGLESIALDWLKDLIVRKEQVFVTCLSCLREMLYDANAVPSSKAELIIGVKFNGAELLC